jgi:hypothetical protein
MYGRSSYSLLCLWALWGLYVFTLPPAAANSNPALLLLPLLEFLL